MKENLGLKSPLITLHHLGFFLVCISFFTNAELLMLFSFCFFVNYFCFNLFLGKKGVDIIRQFSSLCCLSYNFIFFFCCVYSFFMKWKNKTTVKTFCSYKILVKMRLNILIEGGVVHLSSTSLLRSSSVVSVELRYSIWTLSLDLLVWLEPLF